MAGRGSRLRPHTLTIPKPLIPIAGKSIVKRLVQDIIKVCKKKVDEIAFIIGDFGVDIEKELLDLAKELGSKGKVYHQKEALGTAHAILCAKKALNGNVVVAFADTLFKADFKLDNSKDGIIWVSKIKDPSSFGVVKLNKKSIITDFVEKPDTYVSDLAIIGIYYFKKGERLKEELQYLIDNNIKEKGEFQLTSALENLKNSGINFSIGTVDEWLDCGNVDAALHTNKRILEHNADKKLVSNKAKIINSKIISPCYISDNVQITDSIIGPHVSIGNKTRISKSTISNTIIQANTEIKNAKLEQSMLGNYVVYNGKNIKSKLSIGDFSKIE